MVAYIGNDTAMYPLFFPFDLRPSKTLNKRHILVGSLDGRSDWQTRWNSSAIGTRVYPIGGWVSDCSFSISDSL